MVNAKPTDHVDEVDDVVGGSTRPVADATIYLLVSGREAGWALEAWHGSRRAPSLCLAGWGADTEAPPLAAQAAAARALAEQGVAVQDWRPCGDAYGPMYLARGHAPGSAPLP